MNSKVTQYEYQMRIFLSTFLDVDALSKTSNISQKDKEFLRKELCAINNGVLDEEAYDQAIRNIFSNKKE